MNETLSLLFSVIIPSFLLLALSFVGYLVWKLYQATTNTDLKKDDGQLLLLQQQLQEITRSNQALAVSNEQLKTDISERLNDKLSASQAEMTRNVQTQFQESQRLIKDITRELGNVRKTGEQVISFTEQLKNLQDILQNSKQRGALGEYFLETTIQNILPPENFQMQYGFKDGMIADAIIRLQDDKILCIDSKFSLENYNNMITENDAVKKAAFSKVFKEDLKKRVQETTKYIKPNEGTMDFAFMFIPSEGIYYDLLIAKYGTVDTSNFIEYAFREKKVIVVSPSTLYAYLQTVMQGLKALQIEKQASTIRKKVDDLQKHINSYQTYHEKLGNTIGTVVNHYNASSKQMRMISRDAKQIVGSGEVFEPDLLDRPHDEDQD